MYSTPSCVTLPTAHRTIFRTPSSLHAAAPKGLKPTSRQPIPPPPSSALRTNRTGNQIYPSGSLLLFLDTRYTTDARCPRFLRIKVSRRDWDWSERAMGWLHATSAYPGAPSGLWFGPWGTTMLRRSVLMAQPSDWTPASYDTFPWHGLPLCELSAFNLDLRSFH